MALNGKMLDHVLKKFMKAEVAKNARVQIQLPNGEMLDLSEVKLLENRILFSNETHRIVLVGERPVHPIGKIIGKL
jgi:hypothetical protein|tara:strand:+ start:69 stop:296 length:228 start_codon:yes stop_codon:yes gene_type:complete